MPFSIGAAHTNLRLTLQAGLGVLLAILGLIGVLVPGLPGTVFVIAASHQFARSSPALDRWLRRNRWLGPALQGLADAGGMTRAAKALTLASTWMELALGWYVLAGFGPAIQILTIALGLSATATLLLVVRTVPAVRRRRASSWSSYPIAAAGRLLIEPGLLICVTSPLSARDARLLAGSR